MKNYRYICLIKKVFDFKRDNVNVADLCRYVGISRTSFYNIINNLQVPDVYTALLITDYLSDCLVKQGYNPYVYNVSDLFKIYRG